jgi:hypothetical protein
VNLAVVTKALYALLGVLYVLAGIGAMVLPLGWVSPSWAGDEAVPIYQAAAPDSYVNHLTQEFGTLAIAVGFVFLWQARRAEQSLHWLLTVYLMLDASIHWFGPQGLIGSPRRGVINSIPPLIMLTLGLLRERNARATAAAGQISPRPTHNG